MVPWRCQLLGCPPPKASAAVDCRLQLNQCTLHPAVVSLLWCHCWKRALSLTALHRLLLLLRGGRRRLQSRLMTVTTPSPWGCAAALLVAVLTSLMQQQHQAVSMQSEAVLHLGRGNNAISLN